MSDERTGLSGNSDLLHAWDEVSHWTIDEAGLVRVQRTDTTSHIVAKTEEVLAVCEYSADGQLLGIKVPR